MAGRGDRQSLSRPVERWGDGHAGVGWQERLGIGRSGGSMIGSIMRRMAQRRPRGCERVTPLMRGRECARAFEWSGHAVCSRCGRGPVGERATTMSG